MLTETIEIFRENHIFLTLITTLLGTYFIMLVQYNIHTRIPCLQYDLSSINTYLNYVLKLLFFILFSIEILIVMACIQYLVYFSYLGLVGKEVWASILIVLLVVVVTVQFFPIVREEREKDMGTPC